MNNPVYSYYPHIYTYVFQAFLSQLSSYSLLNSAPFHPLLCDDHDNISWRIRIVPVLHLSALTPFANTSHFLINVF